MTHENLGALKERLLCYERTVEERPLEAVEAPVHRIAARVIGCPRESALREARVAMTPDVVGSYVKLGCKVKVEEQAGAKANFSDAMYSEAGAIMVSCEDAWLADVVVKVQPPTLEEVQAMQEGSMLICFMQLKQRPELMALLEKRRITGLAMEQIPRISRAQVYDALSSMANIAGYKAVVEASHIFGRFLGGQMTAAGRIPPAKVLVIGAGVAGLSAIATAQKMGAIVRCFDTRPACKEQVESLGAEFLVLEGFALEEGTGGYAKAMSDDFVKAEMALFAAQAADVDIIVTTALIPDREAPKLITKEAVASMKPGSITIDLAAEQGGNVETTIKDEVVVTANGVTCVGYTDFPSRLPSQASRLYARNVAKLVQALVHPESGELKLDFADLVVRGSIVSFGGVRIWPAPRHLFPPPPAPRKAVAEAEIKKAGRTPRQKTLCSAVGITVGLCVLISLNLISHDVNLLTMVVVFALAGTAGYQAVWGVTPALHTPLMSVTNAVSGVTALGGLLLLAHSRDSLSRALGGAATAASFINIVGGFTVTARMLDMFKRPEDPEEHNWMFFIPAVCSAAVYGVARYGFGVDISELTYLAASLCCVAAIGSLSQQRTARFGNAIGILGVFLGVVCTLGLTNYDWNLGSLAVTLVAVGSLLGTWIGRAVQVTELPQTVAGFHSLVGLAAMVTSLGHFVLHPYTDPSWSVATGLASILGTFIGGVTLTGSLVAFAKLHGIMSSKPLSLPGKNLLNLLLILLQIVYFVLFVQRSNTNAVGLNLLYLTCGLSLFFGWHTVASIGGGDMPVCITVLNSYSGWALVAEGFMLDNLMLTIVGSLIGFSGGILSYIMCVAMNRSLANVLFGGYKTVVSSRAKGGQPHRVHRECTVDDVVEHLVHAKNVIIVPGYGMAVARAQYAVAELASTLRSKNVNVHFGIHPVAGRMPGQMNVLLAEAGVPYDWVMEMDEIQQDFPEADVALVIGANDITNSAAEEDPHCAIAGMPVLQVWNARTCVYLKRTMGSGYADCDNPVFFKENTLMLLGDAKKTTDALEQKLKAYFSV